jgi:hypothetical protein
VNHACNHWWILDFANAFVSPGVNSWAELVPLPVLTPETALHGIGSGIKRNIKKACDMLQQPVIRYNRRVWYVTTDRWYVSPVLWMCHRIFLCVIDPFLLNLTASAVFLFVGEMTRFVKFWFVGKRIVGRRPYVRNNRNPFTLVWQATKYERLYFILLKLYLVSRY